MVHVLDYEDCEAHELTAHIHYSVHCCQFKNMNRQWKVVINVTIYFSETDIPQILFQVTFLYIISILIIFSAVSSLHKWFLHLAHTECQAVLRLLYITFKVVTYGLKWLVIMCVCHLYAYKVDRELVLEYCVKLIDLGSKL